ncbi:MAG: ATP-dependent helicase [Deltaproteobacteria bacterium]|nr:ATP-dependent helicase [Deltaproteobacteria bacterium]
MPNPHDHRLPSAPGHRKIDYRAELNPAQYRAVTTTEGPVLVIAGAGSGKTRTLVYRLAYLVDQGVDPGAILLLTFTRKAAREMLGRAAELMDQPLTQVTGGTFHSVCYLWLRRYGGLLGYGDGFTVMDRDDQGHLLALLKEQLGLKTVQGPFPRKDTVADILGAVVNKRLTLEGVLRDYPQFLPQLRHLDAIAKAYDEEKRRLNLMDFDDLLVQGARLLTEHEEVRRALSERYRYLMVDEYQDTNHLQAELVRLLAYTHHNVMAVGDDCQSIYSFRGANFRNIMDFPALFPGARLIKLEENYRSTQPVLELANAMMVEAREQYTKCLFSRRPDGLKPRLFRPASENEQSRLVVAQVQELRRQGLPLRQMAVLFRAGYHSFDLEIELVRQAIPFMKFGGFKFMESAHIKDLLSYLRVVANPRDTLSWTRLLSLIPGVGRRTCARLTGQMGDGFTLKEARSLLQGQRQAGLKELAGVLEELAGPSQTMVARLNRALEHYEPLMAGRFDDYPKRAKDLEHLLTITARYKELRSFLNDLTLDPPASMADITGVAHDYLTLSTVHSAKGLEWEAVFIIWAAEGRFPVFTMQEREDDTEEERRLMYVAVTRAKRHLAIIFPAAGYNRSLGYTANSPSRFIAGLPRKLLEPWRVEVERG